MSTTIENATIRSTMLGIEDHGLTTAYLILEGAGWGQGFGGYHLGRDGEPIPHCGYFIRRVLETLSKLEWESLTGTNLRIERDGGRIVAIGHYVEDKWFRPDSEFEALKV